MWRYPKKVVEIPYPRGGWKHPRDFHMPVHNFSTKVLRSRTMRHLPIHGPLVYNWRSRIYPAMPRKFSSTGQILLFPSGAEETSTEETSRALSESKFTLCDVALSGSYRKDPLGLQLAYQELLDNGCRLLSPTSVEIAKELEGFVYMKGEESELPTVIESRHLDAIESSTFVWLHAPGGYVGTSAALEVGFANAIGVPVYARESVADPILRSFVRVTASPRAVVQDLSTGNLPVPAPALRRFQSYYRRVATQRGYESENARDCLILMMEEVGELARALRRRHKLVRHGARKLDTDEARELSDVFLYVIHMANVLNIDLSRSVQAKELANLKRFLRLRK